MIRIGQRALKNWAMISLATLSFVAIFFFTVPFPAIVAGAALIGFAGGYCRPDLFGAGAESGAEDGIVDRRMEGGQLDDARGDGRRVFAVVLRQDLPDTSPGPQPADRLMSVLRFG